MTHNAREELHYETITGTSIDQWEASTELSWPMRGQDCAPLCTRQASGHPGYLCRLYYLYQLWWIMYTCGGCSLMVHSKTVFQVLVISVSLEWSHIWYCLSGEGTPWWRHWCVSPAHEVARPITDKYTVTRSEVQIWVKSELDGVCLSRHISENSKWELL